MKDIKIKRIVAKEVDEDKFAEELTNKIKDATPKNYHYKETIKFSTSMEDFNYGSFKGSAWVVFEED